MASNEIKVIFTGDPKQLFQVTDQVEARLKTVFSPSSNPGGSLSFAKSVAKPYEVASHEIKNITGSISRYLRDEERARAAQIQKLKQDSTTIKRLQEDIHVPNIIRRSEESPSAYLSPEQRATEARRRLEFEKRLDAERLAVQSKNLREQEIREYASNERRLRERARVRHQEFLLDREAGMRGGFGGRRTPTAGEMRYGRINLARQAGDVFTTAAMGMNPGMIAIQQGPQIVEAMAMSGGKFATALTSAKAAMVTLGPLLAAGAAAIGVAYKITGDIRKQAEDQLRHEEKIAALLGQQLKQRYELVKSYDEMLRKQQQGFEREDQRRRLESFSDEALKRRAAMLDRIARFGTGANTEKFGNEVADINQLLRERQAQSGDSISNRLANEFAILQQRQAAERAKLQRDIQEGYKQINDLEQTWKNTLQSLSATVNSDNPFVRVFSDAEKAMNDLRAGLKGLPKEMQESALASQRVFNARQMFGARVENAMGVFDLQEMAARFRDDTDQRRAFSQGILDRDRAEYERQLGLGANVNNQAIEESLSRRQRFIDMRFKGDTPADRLDRQLQTLDGLRPQDQHQRALLDQKVLQIAQGLNPNDLRGDQRERVAQIAEREAERQARFYIDSLEVQKQSRDSLKIVADWAQGLREKNAAGGIDAVNQAVEITVKDETSTGVETQQPTPAMTAAYYSGQVQYSGWYL